MRVNTNEIMPLGDPDDQDGVPRRPDDLHEAYLSDRIIVHAAQADTARGERQADGSDQEER